MPASAELRQWTQSGKNRVPVRAQFRSAPMPQGFCLFPPRFGVSIFYLLKQNVIAVRGWGQWRRRFSICFEYEVEFLSMFGKKYAPEWLSCEETLLVRSCYRVTGLQCGKWHEVAEIFGSSLVYCVKNIGRLENLGAKLFYLARQCKFSLLKVRRKSREYKRKRLPH